MPKQHVITATEFKSKCLALLDEVDRNGGAITVTKRGRPVAVVSAAPRVALPSPRNSWAKKGRIVGDIISPCMEWDMMKKD